MTLNNKYFYLLKTFPHPILVGVIMGEFLVSKSGLGYLIMYGSQVFNLNLVIAGIIILCIIAAIMYYLILYIEKRFKR